MEDPCNSKLKNTKVIDQALCLYRRSCYQGCVVLAKSLSILGNIKDFKTILIFSENISEAVSATILVLLCDYQNPERGQIFSAE